MNGFHILDVIIIRLLSHVWLCAPWTAACQASLSFTISWSLFKLISMESLMPSHHLILCHSLLLLHCRWETNKISFKPLLWPTSVVQNSVHLLSRVRFSATPWTAAPQASVSMNNSWSLLKLRFIESVMASNHLILCRPLFLPSVFPSIRVFPNESVLRIRWQNVGALASASVLLMNIQDWFPSWLNALISLQSKGLSRVFSNTTVQTINSLALRFLYSPALTSTGKTITLTRRISCWQSNVSAF